MEQSLRDSRELALKIFDVVPETLLISDARTGEFIDVNSAWAAKMGYRKEEVVGKTSRDIQLWVDMESVAAMGKRFAANGQVDGELLDMRRADGVILTGLNVNESQEMLKAVDKAQLGQPLILGGGANVNNLAQFAELCNGIIVSSAFKTTTGWTREAMTAEWDLDRMRAFMDAWNHL